MNSTQPSWEPAIILKPWESIGSEGSSIHPPRFPSLPSLPVLSEVDGKRSLSVAKELPETHTHYSTRVPYAAPHPCEIQNATVRPEECFEAPVIGSSKPPVTIDQLPSGPSIDRRPRTSVLELEYRSLSLLSDPCLAEKLQMGRFATSKDYDASVLLNKTPSSESSVIHQQRPSPPSSVGTSSSRRLLRLLAEEQTTVDKTSQVALMGFRAVEDSVDGSSEATTPRSRRFRSLALLRREQLFTRSAHVAVRRPQVAEERRKDGSDGGMV